MKRTRLNLSQNIADDLALTPAVPRQVPPSQATMSAPQEPSPVDTPDPPTQALAPVATTKKTAPPPSSPKQQPGTAVTPAGGRSITTAGPIVPPTKTSETVPLACPIAETQHHKLKIHCVEHDLTLNHVVATLLEQFLDHAERHPGDLPPPSDPPNERITNINIRVPKTLRKRLKLLAAANRLTNVTIIRWIIADYLSRQE